MDRPLEYPTLVVGATGGFGRAVTSELLDRGYSVRALVRDARRAARSFGEQEHLQIVAGDVQRIDTLLTAAEGCGTIVHAVNYPYQQWDPQMVTASANVASAATKVGAQILFPGNVYGLGEQTGQPLPETARNQPTSKKGELRVRLEQALAESVQTGVPRVIIVRAGDYFGPTIRNGLVDPIFGRAVEGRPMVIIGNPDIPHQWAYVPDLARVGIDLLEIAGKLKPFEIVHFTGFVPRTQREFVRFVAGQAGHPDLPIVANPVWWRWRAVAGLFVPLLRELGELSYLFDKAVILDDPRRRDLLPTFQPTPIDMAVRKTLDSYVEEAA